MRSGNIGVWLGLLPAAVLAAFGWSARAGAHRQTPDLGTGASLNGKRVFPADNPWNKDISAEPVDPNSEAIIASIGVGKSLHPDFGTTYNGAPNGIPYVVVAGSQPRVPVSFEYAGESDPGPYPIPLDAPIEGGPNSHGDRHVLVVDRDHWKLYELFSSHRDGNGWRGGSGAVFDLNSNTMRPAGWTSADAAGLPIFPGLVRYDEVVQEKAITHAIRFTIVRSRRAYVYPARHFASSLTDPNLPPMGMRVRLKASVDISHFPTQARVILTALKTYGMIVADNGSDWFISGAPDPHWNLEDLETLKKIKGRDFEVVKMGEIVTGRDGSWDRKAAAAYLDQRTTWWMHNMGAIDHETFCISCHTGLPYALVRPALRADLGEQGPSPTERLLLDSVTKRVRLWREVQPFLSGPTESRGTEAVLNALVLVTYEAHNSTLSDDARQALDTLWARQIKQGENTGAWPWFSLGNEPWEAPDSQYWGATLAAVTIGTAPRQYRTAPEIQDNLKLLKEYLLRGEHEQSLLNRLALLGAATKLPGLLSPDQQKSIVDEVLTRQHSDGGWSTSDLVVSTWRRHDGTPQETKSDGYGTGLVAFILEQAGMPRTRDELSKALGWLMRNQNRATGSWPADSVNKQRDPASDVGKFMSDAATAYAVLALTRSGS